MRHILIYNVWALLTANINTRIQLRYSLKCCYFAKFPLLRLDKFLKTIKTKQNLHVQTKVSIFRPSRQTPNAQRQRHPPRLEPRTVRRVRPREPLGGKPWAASPPGSQDQRAGSAAGPSVQWNWREWGREGAEARVQTAATERRLVSLPGVFGPGKSPARYTQGRPGFQGWQEGGARPGGPGGEGQQGSAPRPWKHFRGVSHPPRQDGDVGSGGARPARLGERGGEERQKQKGGPLRSAEAGPRARGGGRAGAPAENAAGGGKGLTFSCRSRRRRPPWRIGPREAFTAGRPQARSGLSAGSLHTRGEKGRHVQKWEVQGGKPLVKPEAGGAGGSRNGPGPAQKSLLSGSLSGPHALDEAAARAILAFPQTRRLCALRSWGSGRGRARAEARSGARGMRGEESVGDAPARGTQLALTQARLTWGGGGFPESQWRGTPAASPTPAHVCLSQSGGGQLRHSWEALPASRARLCAAAEERERSWGAANLGLGTRCLLLGKAVAGFGRRCWEGIWVSSLHHISCSRCSKSFALFLLCGCAVQGCRQLCWVPVQQSRLFTSWQQTLSTLCLHVF